jgi:hypothetical protein
MDKNTNQEKNERIPVSSLDESKRGFLQLTPGSKDSNPSLVKNDDTGSPQSTEDELGPTGESPIERQVTTGEVYSVFTVNQKRAIILTASLAAFFSPLSSSIYYPSLPTIATELHVSNSAVNLTVTTYLVRPRIPIQVPFDNANKSSRSSRAWHR